MQIANRLHSRDLDDEPEDNNDTMVQVDHYWFLPSSYLSNDTRQAVQDGLGFIAHSLESGALFDIGSKAGNLLLDSIAHHKRELEDEDKPLTDEDFIKLQAQIDLMEELAKEEELEEKESKNARPAEVHHWYYPSEYLSPETEDALKKEGKFVVKGLAEGVLMAIGGKIGDKAWHVIANN